MGFRILSLNSITLLQELSEDEELVKLLYYTDRNPLDKKPLPDGGVLIPKTLNPTPFAGAVPKNERVELRVFFPEGRISNRVRLNSTVTFQIVIHRNLWMISDSDGEMKLRPYEIMNRIVKIFQDITIKELGVLHFTNYNYLPIDEDYGVYSLRAQGSTYQEC